MTDIKMVPDIVEQTTDDVSAPEILDEPDQVEVVPQPE